MTATGTGPQPTLMPEAAEPLAPGRARRLDLALSVVRGGPRPFYLAAVASLAGTSVLAMAIAELTRPPGPLAGTQRHIFMGALAAFCASSALGMTSLAANLQIRPPAWLDRVVGRRERMAIWLALAVWFPFLLIVVYYRAKATFPHPVHYIYSPYDDKRWETAAFLLAALAPALLVVTAARVLAVGRDQPPTWQAWFTGLFPRAAAADRNPDKRTPSADARGTGAAGNRADGWRTGARWLLRVAAGLATGLGLAWYFLGPSWHLTSTSAPISRQEDVWLIGLQAMAKGHLPYVGVAEVPYGPGTQVATYLLMHHVTAFSMVGFREAWALEVWAGASILFAVFFLAFGYVRGLAVSLLSALVYPALWMVAFHPGGSFNGYFGWFSPLRYVGLIALVLLLPAVVRRCPSWRGAAAGAAIGALWGLMSYMAQENLAGGVVGALAVAALLVFSGSSPWRAVRAALLATLAGFLLIWAPILAYYEAHRQLGDFLGQYLLFPSAVAEGINDTPWQGFAHTPSPYTRMFYVLPFVLAALALAAVFQVRPLRIATEWSRARTGLVATVVVTILLYQGVLLRSDQSHLTGTLLMVPAVVIIAGAALPRLLGARHRVTAALAGAALVVASFTLLPSSAYAWNSVRSAAELPYLARQQLAAGPRPAAPTTLAATRVGPGLSDAPQCCQGGPVSMGQFVHLMELIHVIVGNRVAYVANFHGAYPGLVYFVADLNPAPIASYEYDGSTLTESQLKAYLADFRTRVLPQVQALLTYSTKAPEAEYFLNRYPNAEQIKLRYDRQDYFVLLRDNGNTTGKKK